MGTTVKHPVVHGTTENTKYTENQDQGLDNDCSPSLTKVDGNLWMELQARSFQVIRVRLNAEKHSHS